jgi:hypothetical protein
VLRCEECRAETAQARGWRALVCTDPEDPTDEPVVAFYCPWCAEREFGFDRRDLSWSTGPRSLIDRIHNPSGRECGCPPECWCKRTPIGRVLRWYIPSRHHLTVVAR